jgi:hypothetical protein
MTLKTIRAFLCREAQFFCWGAFVNAAFASRAIAVVL